MTRKEESDGVAEIWRGVLKSGGEVVMRFPDAATCRGQRRKRNQRGDRCESGIWLGHARAVEPRAASCTPRATGRPYAPDRPDGLIPGDSSVHYPLMHSLK